MAEKQRYSVFGLTIESDIELPELATVDGGRVADLSIRLDHGPWVECNHDHGVAVYGESTILSVPEVAQFEVDRTGAKVLVRPREGVPPRNLRLYLLGSAMGLILHRRGLLPLHCNAVEVNGVGFAFAGHSGAGKSTLAAWLLDHGFDHLADDVSVIWEDSAGRFRLYPGISRLRLFDAPLRRSGRDPRDYEQSFLMHDEIDKFDVPVPSTGRSSPLEAIFLLNRGGEVSLERLSGADAVDALMANTYRGAFLTAPDERRRHWMQCIAIVRSVPVLRFTRRWDEDCIDEDARWLSAKLTSWSSSQTGSLGLQDE
jgi:hypothetical protein